MYRRLVLAALIGMILINSLPYAFAQSNIYRPVDEQRLIIAQQNTGDAAANDRAFWDSVKDTKNPDELKAYLEQFPTGIFAPLARARLKALESGGTQSQSVNTTIPAATVAKEIAKDGRFIAYDDGTVLDTETHLMWAEKDNGKGINWLDAKSYCENFRGGGYTDWRMPDKAELAELLDDVRSNRKPIQSECSTIFGTSDLYLRTGLVRLTCTDIWASETKKSFVPLAVFVNFSSFKWDLHNQKSSFPRVIPVRSAK